MHWPTQGQWWSKRSTQLLQTEQCEQRGGRYSMHVWQYFTFTTTPFTYTSRVGGSDHDAPVAGDAKEELSVAASSGSGGRAFRGMMPGSRPDVSTSTTTSRTHARTIAMIS